MLSNLLAITNHRSTNFNQIMFFKQVHNRGIWHLEGFSLVVSRISNSQSASLSWCQAPIWNQRPIFPLFLLYWQLCVSCCRSSFLSRLWTSNVYFAQPSRRDVMKASVPPIFSAANLWIQNGRLQRQISKNTPIRDLHISLQIPYVYDYITKLCRQRAQVIQHHANIHVPNIVQGEPRHRKYKRLELGGGRACLFTHSYEWLPVTM
jgi:hypothetical protein